jgi:Glycosyl transferase family 2
MKKIRCRRRLLLYAFAFLTSALVATNLRLLGLSTNSSTIINDGQKSNNETTRTATTTLVAIQQQEQPQKHLPETALERRRRWKKLRASDIPLRKESLMPNATFSACLLIRDDNDLLPEWLAYHYHAVKLRHLIVATDPLSSESPSSIFETWRQYTEMKITEWTDVDYMPQAFLNTGRAPRKYTQKQADFKIPMTQEAMAEVTIHRYRQRVFLAKCLKAQRDDGNSWLMHIDTDEFVVASKLLRTTKPDYIKHHLPNLTQPNSVLHFIQKVAQESPLQINYPCMSVLRVLFGSVESPDEEEERSNNIKNVVSIFNATTFETLRFQYHAPPDNVAIRGNPKVIMDIAAMPEEYFASSQVSSSDAVVYSIHRPFENFCRKNSQLIYENYRNQPIAVNHYLGSWERYIGRKNDKRRSRQLYDDKASHLGQERDNDGMMRNWLSGFIATVGTEDTAAKLLRNAHLLS